MLLLQMRSRLMDINAEQRELFTEKAAAMADKRKKGSSVFLYIAVCTGEHLPINGITFRKVSFHPSKSSRFCVWDSFLLVFPCNPQIKRASRSGIKPAALSNLKGARIMGCEFLVFGFRRGTDLHVPSERQNWKEEDDVALRRTNCGVVLVVELRQRYLDIFRCEVCTGLSSLNNQH